MKFFVFTFLLLVIITIAALSQSSERVELWKFEDLESFIRSKEDAANLKVINFWATWCAPCIKELPYYEEVNTNYKNNVEVLLVSLDFSEDLEKKVIPFLKRKKIGSRVVILTDENYNEWIDKVDPSWSGAIPATLFVSGNGDKKFYEKEFEREELISIVEELKPKNNNHE